MQALRPLWVLLICLLLVETQSFARLLSNGDMETTYSQGVGRVELTDENAKRLGIDDLTSKLKDFNEQAEKIEVTFSDFPLPKSADEKLRQQHHKLEEFKASYEKRIEILNDAIEAAQEDSVALSGEKLEEIIKKVEAPAYLSEFPSADLRAYTREQQTQLLMQTGHTRERAYEVLDELATQKDSPPSAVRDSDGEAKEELSIADLTSRLEHLNEQAEKAETILRQYPLPKSADEKLSQQHHQLELYNESNEERAKGLQRVIERAQANSEALSKEEIDAVLKKTETPSDLKEFSLAGPAAYIREQQTHLLMQAGYSEEKAHQRLDDLEQGRSVSGAYSGRSEKDPFLAESPPYPPNVGEVWVRDKDTSRWSTVSEEKYLERRLDQAREQYGEALGQRLPVKKSIYVYDVNTGQERLLNADDGYEVQVSGYGPRQSIRTRVYDRDGRELPGDFITKRSNMTKGSDQVAVEKALYALKEIRKAGDITIGCHVGREDAAEQNVPPEDEYYDPRVYKRGCEALARGVSPSDSQDLKTCIGSILNYVKQGRNRCEKIKRMFSLREDEQDFAGMLMTTKGEAPVGLPGGSADHLMIMKSLDNRKQAVKRINWSTPLSTLDIALQPWQYSAYNDWDEDNKFDSRRFLEGGGYNKLVDSFISYQSADWQPPGLIDNVTHYYSPPAMEPKYRKPSWVGKKSTSREVTSLIRANGGKVVNRAQSPSGYHKFYVGIDGKNNYSARRTTRAKLSKCQ